MVQGVHKIVPLSPSEGRTASNTSQYLHILNNIKDFIIWLKC